MTKFSIINLLSVLSAIISNIIFIVYLNLGALALTAGTLIANLVQLVLYRVFSDVKVDLSKQDHALRKQMLIYSLPLIPMTVASWFLSLSDRYIVLAYLGEEQVGIYSITTRFSGMISVFTGAIYTAYTSFAFSKKNEDNAKQQYSRILNVIFLFSLAVCFSISIFSKEILQLMVSAEYQSASYAIPGVLFGQVFYAVNTITSYGLNFSKRTVYLLISTIVSSVANVSLNLWLTPQYGIVATSLINILAYLIMCLLNYYFAQKQYPVKYQFKRIIGVTIISLGLLFVFSSSSFIIRLLIWFLVAIFVCYLFRVAVRDIWTVVKMFAEDVQARFSRGKS